MRYALDTTEQVCTVSRVIRFLGAPELGTVSVPTYSGVQAGDVLTFDDRDYRITDKTTYHNRIDCKVELI